MKFCAIFSSHARRVLHGADRRPERPGGGRASPCARPTAARRSRRSTRARERVLELQAEQARVWARRAAARRSPPRASSSCASSDSREAERAELAAPLRARHLPGADAARRRPRTAVPVHLGPVAQPRRVRPRSRRRARSASRASRCPRACRASSRSATASRPLRPARAGDRRTSCRRSSRAWTIVERVRLPRHARRRLRGLGRGRRPARGGRARAAPAPLRRGHARRGVGRDVAARCASAFSRASRRRRSRSIRSTARSTSRTPPSWRSSTGPT